MLKYVVLIMIIFPIINYGQSANTVKLTESERMERIKKDFTKTEHEVREYIQTYIPDVTDARMRNWEADKSLEYMIIEGQKRYFKYAARNLFRIDSTCRSIWQEAHPEEKKKTENRLDLDEHNKMIIRKIQETGQQFVNPVHLRIHYTISVDADVIPVGEILRCWIPYPIEIPHRQTDIRLIETQPEQHQLAAAEQLQRTVYLEKKAEQGKKTEFSVIYEYTSFGTFTAIDPTSVETVQPKDELQEFLVERPPHIVFSDELKELSQKIIDGEKNPYLRAQKLFSWVDENIPWASAREYSTIQNLSHYPYENKHGDCGLQTMLFITLCRLNGIPARWQSGWEFQPPHDSMHDWGMVYFEPYGWVPMDVTFGLRKTDDKKLKWFYLNGMDSYRLIFNEDYAQPFSPVKTFVRSETIDSQRGEVEWHGGNLYFDQWDWDMEWKVLSP